MQIIFTVFNNGFLFNHKETRFLCQSSLCEPESDTFGDIKLIAKSFYSNNYIGYAILLPKSLAKYKILFRWLQSTMIKKYKLSVFGFWTSVFIENIEEDCFAEHLHIEWYVWSNEFAFLPNNNYIIIAIEQSFESFSYKLRTFLNYWVFFCFIKYLYRDHFSLAFFCNSHCLFWTWFQNRITIMKIMKMNMTMKKIKLK